MIKILVTLSNEIDAWKWCINYFGENHNRWKLGGLRLDSEERAYMAIFEIQSEVDSFWFSLVWN